MNHRIIEDTQTIRDIIAQLPTIEEQEAYDCLNDIAAELRRFQGSLTNERAQVLTLIEGANKSSKACVAYGRQQAALPVKGDSK